MLTLTLGAVGPAGKAETPPRPVRSEISTDLLGTGNRVRIRLDPASATPVVVIDVGRKVAVPVKSRWRPWRIRVADLGGDGRREIVVAVFKPTHYILKPHNCLFVYRYDGRQAYALWQGSTLGRPFTDFTFGHIGTGEGERLVTLDVWLDGKRGVSVHRWNGFGFRREALWGRWKRARLVGIQNGRIVVIADGRRIERAWKDRE